MRLEMLMTRKRIMMALAGAATVWCAAPLAVTYAAQVGPAGSGWGQAIEVPGLAPLNAHGLAEVQSVSCASPGNCAAGGFYSDRFFNGQAFVASQRNGRWGTAIEVPGLAPLNLGGEASVLSVSCGSAGNCAAGGYTTGGSGRTQAFVASERNGRWSKAIIVPGMVVLNAGGNARAISVSCASAGNCTVGGSYSNGSQLLRAFVVSERNGRWGTAIEVPGMASLHAGAGAGVLSVSCASAGSCAAGGFYFDRARHTRAFLADQRNGRWATAIRAPGTDKLNAGGFADVLSVSCASAGNCAAGGFYHDRTDRGEAFVASERNGRWGTAIEVPGTASLNSGGAAQVLSVSCTSAANCSAGGFYYGSGHRHAFVVSQRNRRWGQAIEVRGTNFPNAVRGGAEVLSVSCASAGNCVAGGFYTDNSGHGQAYLASQQNGRWGTAIEVPGTASLNTGGTAQVSSVSCNRPGPCTAVGNYDTDSIGSSQGFVVSRS